MYGCGFIKILVNVRSLICNLHIHVLQNDQVEQMLEGLVHFGQKLPDIEHNRQV